MIALSEVDSRRRDTVVNFACSIEICEIGLVVTGLGKSISTPGRSITNKEDLVW
jgi:hypothetical protein